MNDEDAGPQAVASGESEEMSGIRGVVDAVVAQRTGNDEAILRVLLEISAKLSRLEDRLAPPSPAVPVVESDQILVRTSIEDAAKGSIEGGSQGSSAAADDEDEGSDESNSFIAMEKVELKTNRCYYKVQLEALLRVKHRARTFPHAQFYFPIDQVQEVLSEIPASVSNNDWRYYMPVWEDDNNETRQIYDSGLLCEFEDHHGGHGRHNFIGIWDTERAILHHPSLSSRGQYYQRIPYSATVPPTSMVHDSYWRSPLSNYKVQQLDNQFGGIWKLPPDFRLSLMFQQHILRGLGPHVDFVEYTGRIQSSMQKLTVLGGEISVREIDDAGHSYTYKPFDNTSPADVDEWLLYIEPMLVTCDNAGFPSRQDYSAQHARWSRFITISGLADTFESCPWTELGHIEWSGDTDMFVFHTSCELKPHELELPDFFHICWVEIQNSNILFIPEHQSWKQSILPENPGKAIAMVAGSFQAVRRNSFSDKLHRNTDFWTILCLTPRSTPKDVVYDDLMEGGGGYNFWFAIAYAACGFISEASNAWQVVAKTLEDMLSLGQDQQATIEDDKFSQSQKLFWVINKIDSFLPLLADAVIQWDWFKGVNKLDDMNVDILFHQFSEEEIKKMGWLGHEWGSGSPVKERDAQKELYELVEFKEILQRGDKLSARLQKLEERFMAMRDRAKSLRDGLFALTSVKEARDARLLGENVKLLTYVTIFYLPLAFCTSMWAINDMFGTGTKGFIGITIWVAFATYAGVVALMYPNEIGIAFGRFGRRLGWTGEVGDAKSKGVELKGGAIVKGKVKITGIEKGKEMEKDIASVEGITIAETKVRQRPKKMIGNLFRRGKAEARDQEAGNAS